MTRLRTPLILVWIAALGLPLALSACSRAGGEQNDGYGVPAIGGAFQLTDQNGRTVDQRVLDHKWSAVFFGYTYCPDVCPTTLTTLGRAQSALGGKARDFQVVFVSVDPGRDTPAQLKTYLTSPVFPKGTLGLTGTPDRVAEAAKAYKVFYQKAGTGTAYTVDHTSAIYLMDPLGKFNRVLAENLSPDELDHQIREAMASGPKAGA